MERTRNETKTGLLGWGLVGAAVIGAEVIFEESLTHAFRRGLDNPKYRPYMLGALAVTSLHLMDRLPRPVDPFILIEAVGKTALEVYRNI